MAFVWSTVTRKVILSFTYFKYFLIFVKVVLFSAQKVFMKRLKSWISRGPICRLKSFNFLNIFLFKRLYFLNEPVLEYLMSHFFRSMWIKQSQWKQNKRQKKKQNKTKYQWRPKYCHGRLWKISKCRAKTWQLVLVKNDYSMNFYVWFQKLLSNIFLKYKFFNMKVVCLEPNWL